MPFAFVEGEAASRPSGWAVIAVSVCDGRSVDMTCAMAFLDALAMSPPMRQVTPTVNNSNTVMKKANMPLLRSLYLLPPVRISHLIATPYPLPVECWTLLAGVLYRRNAAELFRLCIRVVIVSKQNKPK
jgi:hypothetical protein